MKPARLLSLLLAAAIACAQEAPAALASKEKRECSSE
jgi:hypothetical protein